MKRLTVSGLAISTRMYPCGDITYIPQGIVNISAGSPSALVLRDKKIFRGIPKNVGVVDSPGISLMNVENSYENYRSTHRGREPWWIRKATDGLKRLLRESWVTGEGSDPFAIVHTDSRSGVGYVVKEDGITAETVRTFNLTRLNGIRQLAFLHDPKGPGENLANVAMHFEHTRYLHVLNVAAIANLIARNNGLSVSDRRHLRVAALTHDALTPAGGDTTKIVDPQGFDEDLHYPELFERFDCSEYLHRFRLSKDLLKETVLGRGVLGRILDIADKVAYVAHDTATYLDSPRVVFQPERILSVRRYVRKHPFVCGIWDAVRVENGEVFVEDSKRLMNFLQLRATLFAEVYYNPSARFFEHTIASVVIKYLYDKGELTRDMLLEMTDNELEDAVFRVTGAFYSCGIEGVSHAEVKTFSSVSEAKMFEEELGRRSPAWVFLVENFVGATSTGSKIKVAPGVTFASAHPKETETLNGIMAKNLPVRVYHFPISENFTPRFREALQAYQNLRNKPS